jgi:oligopeptidase A
MSLGAAFAATGLSVTARALRSVRPGASSRLALRVAPVRSPLRVRSVTTMATLEANPLASWTYGLGEKAGEAPDLPKWSSIKDEHVKPAITAAVAAANAEIDAIEKRLAEAESPPSTWAEIMDPLERLSEKLSRPWGVVSHLKGVRDSDDLRAAYDECQPEVVTASLRIGQSRPVYDAMVGLMENEAAFRALTPAQQRAVECEVRDAKLSGVALDGTQKERYNEIAKELSALSTEFSNNVLDATKAFEHLCVDKTDVAGLPKSALEQAAQTAKTRGKHENATAEDGPWMFTLDAPSYMAVRSHAENRALREKVYRAYLARASQFFEPFASTPADASEPKKLGDNAPLIERILTLRQEKAALLGYDNFAEVSMAKKMATLATAESLLEDIRAKSFPAAERELEEIRAFAAERGAPEASTGLMQWDVGFWAERLREAKYELKEEDLRPYFQLPAVIDGMFELAEQLFGVKVEAADGEVEVWHPDVRFFKVLDAQSGAPRAYFYLDPYTRPAEKRGGAWMDDVVGRSAAMAAPGASVRLPTAHMVCNGTPPVGDKPSLMTHNEVTTLFHEFGHALQHMLTTEDVGPVAGINQVDWDAVELPSQFMENFCYDKKVLKKIGKHHETGEPLPDDLFEKLVKSKNFGSGTRYLRQCHFAMTDLELHARYKPGEGADAVFAAEAKIATKTMLMPAIKEDRFLCGFGHIFAGGYSAGYYSYLWAEVLSADAFGAFEEAGALEDEKTLSATGGKFAGTVLAMGGGAAPMEVFKAFRGREPSVDALLRHNGLVATTA